MKLRKQTVGIIGGGIIAITGALMFVPRVAKGEIDLPAINQTLQNHEARISNNEKDIKALQNNTNTPPSPDHVSVPSASSSNDTQTTGGIQENAVSDTQNTPVAPTKKITGVTPISNIGSVVSFQCRYDYDDGTSETVDVPSQDVTVTGDDGVTHTHSNPVCLPIGTSVPK